MDNKDDERLRNTTIAFLKEFADKGYENAVECIAWLEKQGEQTSANKIEPKFKTGDRVIGIVSGMQYYITEVCDDYYYTESGCTIMFYAQDNFELYKQKPAEWSKDDEEIISDAELWLYTLCSYLKDSSSEYIPNVRVIISKLKSLKSRIPPKQEWSEEDEKKRNLLIDILNVNHPNGYFKVNPANTLNMEAIHTEELVDWLKSLRPQKQWKPSEEQIGVIEAIINNTSFQKRHLNSLYEQLKKLREE